MNYYFIDGNVYQSEIELNSGNGYPHAVSLTQPQYEFGINNKGASLDEIQVMQLNPVVPTLQEFKNAKLQELDTWAYLTFIYTGYNDAETGYTLFCGAMDVANYATLKNAIFDLPDNKVVEFGTMTGWQTSTREIVYPLLSRYAEFMLPRTTTYLKAQSQIEYAQSQEELDAITWGI